MSSFSPPDLVAELTLREGAERSSASKGTAGSAHLESHRQRVLACFDPYWPVLKSTVACFQIANLVLQ
jgi:hypothetical protein